MFTKKQIIIVMYTMALATGVGQFFDSAAWAGAGDYCAMCHTQDAQEEVMVYGIRPTGSAGWLWSTSGWVSPVTQGYYNAADYPYMEEFQECAQEDMACILSKTNCSAPIDLRRAFASQPGLVLFMGPGTRYDVNYPGFPGTHWETWEVQYIILGTAYVGSVGGCHGD